MKNSGRMITPDNRSEFENNLFLVIEDAKEKIEENNEDVLGSFAYFTLPHLKKVKTLPNGRVNLLTVDENLRLQANMQKNLEFMPPPIRLPETED